MDLLHGLFITLILGSYSFTWAAYKHLAKQVEEILVNHLKHQKEEQERLERKVDAFILAHYKNSLPLK